MFALATSLAVAMLAALPPHPLDEVFGNTQVTAEQAEQMLLKSQAFADVIQKAVDAAQRAPINGVSYAAHVRLSIAAQLRLEDDDGQPLTPEGQVAASPLDEVIGTQTDPKAILKSFAGSKAFANLVGAAIKQSRPLRRGMAGPSFGQSFRIRFADGLAPFSEGDTN